MSIKRLYFDDGTFWDVAQIGGIVEAGSIVNLGIYHQVIARWESVAIGQPVQAYGYSGRRSDPQHIHSAPLVRMEVING